MIVEWPCVELTAIYGNMLLFNFINTIYLITIAYVKFASDQEWFRKRILSLVLIAVQVIVAGINYIRLFYLLT